MRYNAAALGSRHTKQATLLCLRQDMVRNMRRRLRTAATKAGPVIDVYQAECTVWGHQTIPAINVQAQDLASLLGQRRETVLIDWRAVSGMRREGVYHSMTTHGIKFQLLADNMLLYNGMANATLAQTEQLRWHVCRVAHEYHIV